MKLSVLIIFGLGMASGLGALVFILSGVYDIAAIRPHTQPVQFLLTAVKRNSIETHARDLEVPDLRNVDLIKRGFILYRRHCVLCHGAPGEPRSRTGVG